MQKASQQEASTMQAPVFQYGDCRSMPSHHYILIENEDGFATVLGTSKQFARGVATLMATRRFREDLESMGNIICGESATLYRIPSNWVRGEIAGHIDDLLHTEHLSDEVIWTKLQSADELAVAEIVAEVNPANNMYDISVRDLEVGI